MQCFSLKEENALPLESIILILSVYLDLSTHFLNK